MRVWYRFGLASLLLASMLLGSEGGAIAQSGGTVVPTPKATGPVPVTADSYPSMAADTLQDPIDLRARGYVEEEFFVSGAANVYDWGADGALTSEATATIAQHLRVSADAVESMAIRLGARDQSTNAPSGEGYGEWGDILPDTAPNPEDVVAEAHEREAVGLCLAAALKELTPRERTIISRRHLLDDGATLRDLGCEFGISKERVRQIENRALGKLRRAMEQRFKDDLTYYG